MTLNANAMTTLAFAKTFLKIPSAETSMDTLVEFWINAASEYLESECDRKFAAQSFVEYISGNKSNFILTAEWPINSVTEIKVDSSGAFTDPNTIWDSSEYGIGEELQVIVARQRMFPTGYRNIKLTYNAGYSTIPIDLTDACLWLVQWYRMMRDSGDIGRPNKGKDGESSTILQTAPKHVRDAIDRHKRSEFANSPRMVRSE